MPAVSLLFGITLLLGILLRPVGGVRLAGIALSRIRGSIAGLYSQFPSAPHCWRFAQRLAIRSRIAGGVRNLPSILRAGFPSGACGYRPLAWDRPSYLRKILTAITR